MVFNANKLRLFQVLYYSLFLVGTIATLSEHFVVGCVGAHGGVPHPADVGCPLGLSVPDSSDIGRLLGVWSLTALAVQIPLSSRASWLERNIGLDKLIGFHSFNARFMLMTVLLHPLLIFSRFFGVLTTSQIINSLSVAQKMGSLTLFLFFIIIVTSMYSKKLKLKYEWWQNIHLLSYVSVLTGFFHAYYAGSLAYVRSPLWYWYWVLLTIGVAGILTRIHTKFFKKQWYKVVSVIKEASDVRTIVFTSAEKKPMSFAPGQFAFAQIYSKGLPTEEHHFSLAGSPQASELSFTIKAVGDYTSQLDKIKPGDKMAVDGPYGVLSNRGMTGPFVFIAGGIGITPIMSMLRDMRDRGTEEKAVLIYACKTKEELVFAKELEQMAEEKWFELIYVFSQEKVLPKINKNTLGHVSIYGGRISTELLGTLKIKWKQASAFIVGPVPFMEAAKTLVFEKGVPKKKIFSERFDLK